MRDKGTLKQRLEAQPIASRTPRIVGNGAAARIVRVTGADVSDELGATFATS